jgi:alpha-tubulin suppressor-like RCC1 family protein
LNYLAELGLGDSKLVATPQRIPFPAGTRIKQVACGSNHSLVLTEAGRLFSMGHNGYGELGLGDNGQRLSPSHVNHFSTTRVRAICAGGSFSFAITEDEKLWAWYVSHFVGSLNYRDADMRPKCRGNNVGGELGLGNTVASYNTPQLVPFFANKKIKLMSSGHCHTLVYTETGELYVFGDAFDGQLGLGDEVAHPEPTLNPFFSNYRIKTIHASFFHSFVVTG